MNAGRSSLKLYSDFYLPAVLRILSDVSADRLRSTREVIRQYAGLDKDSRTLIKNMLLSLTDKISKARFEK